MSSADWSLKSSLYVGLLYAAGLAGGDSLSPPHLLLKREVLLIAIGNRLRAPVRLVNEGMPVGNGRGRLWIGFEFQKILQTTNTLNTCHNYEYVCEYDPECERDGLCFVSVCFVV